jgi:hypothetical protein
MLHLVQDFGMASAFSLSALIQLIAVNVIAVASFGERLARDESLGIVLAVVAVGLSGAVSARSALTPVTVTRYPPRRSPSEHIARSSLRKKKSPSDSPIPYCHCLMVFSARSYRSLQSNARDRALFLHRLIAPMRLRQLDDFHKKQSSI